MGKRLYGNDFTGEVEKWIGAGAGANGVVVKIELAVQFHVLLTFKRKHLNIN